MAAAQATLQRRLVVAFQPHRYSRTAHLMDAFGPALRGADEIVLLDIYAASEEPIAGVTVERLAESIGHRAGRPVHVARTLDDALAELLRIVRPVDAVITLGAGSISALPKRLTRMLAERGAAS
jgi:UDP-N-acetylmuramate--alanine ligase